MAERRLNGCALCATLARRLVTGITISAREHTTTMKTQPERSDDLSGLVSVSVASSFAFVRLRRTDSLNRFCVARATRRPIGKLSSDRLRYFPFARHPPPSGPLATSIDRNLRFLWNLLFSLGLDNALYFER